MNKKKKSSAGKDFKSKSASKSSLQKKERSFYIFIFTFAFLLYANTLSSGYVLDDDVVYLQNKDVQEGFSGIGSILHHSFIYGFIGHNDQSYRPVVSILFAIEKQLFGNNPHVGHFINVLLFALSCVLLYQLTQKLFRNFSFQAFSAFNFQFSIPFLVTLLFTAHPIHTEAVSNIKGRDDILNFIFLELSLWYILKHVDEGQKKYFVFGVLFFFLSLLCKEMAVTFLAIIPLTLFFFREVPIKKIALGTISFAVAFGLYMLIRSSVLETVTFAEKMKVVNNALAAATNSSDRIATALFIQGKYILLLFFPYPLSWDYSFNQIPIVSFTDIKVIITLIVFAALGIFALMNLKKKDIFSYSILFFFITMSVVSNIFIMIGSTLGERFLFTPSLAFCIAIPFFLKRFNKNIFLAAMGIILVLFSFKTYSRNKDWESNFTLFLSGVNVTPNSSRAESAAGSAYREQAEKEQNPNTRLTLYQKAIPYYKKAIEILPENTEALYNLGVSLYSIGEKDSALQLYERALKVSPDYTNASNNAGVIYFERKDYNNAKKYFEEALKYNPNNSDALGNLGAINHNLGNLQEAISYYKRALQLNPTNQNIQANLAKAEQALGVKK